MSNTLTVDAVRPHLYSFTDMANFKWRYTIPPWKYDKKKNSIQLNQNSVSSSPSPYPSSYFLQAVLQLETNPTVLILQPWCV